MFSFKHVEPLQDEVGVSADLEDEDGNDLASFLVECGVGRLIVEEGLYCVPCTVHLLISFIVAIHLYIFSWNAPAKCPQARRTGIVYSWRGESQGDVSLHQ